MCTGRRPEDSATFTTESIRNGSYDFSTTPVKEHHLLEVFSDSDSAGRKDTRRSTSSGTIFLDGQCIYSFSRNQKSVSLSSGEAEYYASDSILLQEVHTGTARYIFIWTVQQLEESLPDKV